MKKLLCALIMSLLATPALALTQPEDLIGVNLKVTRVTFMSNEGSIMMMNWPKGQVCALSLDSQGGFAGINNQPCQE